MADDKTKIHGKIWSSAHYAGKDLHIANETQIEVRTFDAPHATVKTSYGLTLNLGNFESARVDAGVELPCYVEEISKAFQHAWELCQDEIQKQVKSLRSE